MKKTKILIFLTLIFSSFVFSQNIIDYDGVLQIAEKNIPDGKYDINISLLDPAKNNMLVWNEVHKDVVFNNNKFSLKMGNQNFSLKNILKNYDRLLIQFKIPSLNISNTITLNKESMIKALEKKSLVLVKEDEEMIAYEERTLFPRWLCPNIMIAGEAKDFVRIFIVNREKVSRKVKLILYSTSGQEIDVIRKSVPPLGRIEIFRGYKDQPASWCEIHSDGEKLYPSGYLFAEEYRFKDEKYWFEWYLNTALKWHKID